MRRFRALTTIVVCLAVLLAGCNKHSTTSQSSTNQPSATTSVAVAAAGGECPTSNTTAFAKTKFVLHTGLAAGTFHRYVYSPLKAGSFASGASGRVLALAKAGATALFDAHEIRLAIEDVKANPTLCKLVIAPLHDAATKFDALKSKITHGDTSAVNDVNATVTGIESTAGAAGVPITESTDQSQG